MTTIAIVAGGPNNNIPDLNQYKAEIDLWVGADKGALTLIQSGVTPDIAVGDFDSLNKEEKDLVQEISVQFQPHPVEKDETDLEIAINYSIEKCPDHLYLFGVTGGRLDHGLASIQLLYKLKEKDINGIIIDENNWIELRFPGKHPIDNDSNYKNISFLPFSNKVIGISLEGFYYKLNNKNIFWGSTLCISNRLLNEKGHYSFTEGILLVIKSRDVLI